MVASPVQFDPCSLPIPNIRYYVSMAHLANKPSASKRGALVDRGANGGIIGSDARVMIKHQRQVDVTGIDNHEMSNLEIVDASAVINTQYGEAIGIFRQYAYTGRGRSIHSCSQIEHYKNQVDDRSMKAGGRQCIRTNDGYIIPINIIRGLPYIQQRPNTDKEFEDLPHVIMTSSEEWDPKVMDFKLSDTEAWHNLIQDLDRGLYDSPFDRFGNLTPDAKRKSEEIEEIEANLVQMDTVQEIYKRSCNLNEVTIPSETPEDPIIEFTRIGEIKRKPIDIKQYRPYFLHVPDEVIRQTFKNTTQYASSIMSGPRIQKTLKSPYPAQNVRRREEPVATDYIYAATEAVDTPGYKGAQVYVGRKSRAISIHGCKGRKHFVPTLIDEIRKHGAMTLLISDGAQEETSTRAIEVLRSFLIQHWQSEPYFQHQNWSEHVWHFAKDNVQWYMTWRNVQSNAWLLCLEWVCDIMNHTAVRSLGWRTPMEVLQGQTVDISKFLCFLFWDIVYCDRYESSTYNGNIGHDKKAQIRGRFVGFSWDVGHKLTFKVLVIETQRVIRRSVL